MTKLLPKGDQQSKKSDPILAKTFARYRGHFGPSGPKLQKESENEFPGPLGPGAPKVRNGGNKKVKIDEKLSNLTRFGSVLDFLDARCREAPGTHSNSFCHFGPEGPK